MARDTRSTLASILLVAAGIAGCLGSDPTGTTGAGALTLPPIDQGHDHLDPSLHGPTAMGFTVLASMRVDEGAFPQPGIAGLDLGNAGRMKLAGDLLLIASDRETRSGFVTVDVSDPAVPVPLGAYRSDAGASEGEALAVTADGTYAFVSIETAYSPRPAPPAIEIVDLSNPANPRLAARVPTQDQPHVLSYAELDGQGYLIASMYQLSIVAAGAPAAIGLGPTSSVLHASATIFTFDPAVPLLTPVGSFRYDPREIEEQIYFVHDTTVREHPVTGERLLYVGAFGGGGRILSLADPTLPTQVGYTLDKGVAPVLRHHSFEPAPALRDGVLATAAVPRSGEGDGPGSAYLSLYDTSDPTAPVLLGQWRHPDTDFLPGDFPPLNLHIPAFSADARRLIVPHFHGGLFAFDVSTRAAMQDLEAIAHWHPGAAPDEGARAAGIIAAAIEKDGVWLSIDTSTGTLYSLRLDA